MRRPKVLLLTAIFLVAAVAVMGCAVKVTGVTLNKTEVTLAVGETVQLTATVSPDDATDREVTWASDDEDVATVNQDGLVEAVSAGVAKISAATKDGGFKAECTVTVVNPVTGVKIFCGDDEAEELELAAGASLDLSAVISPDIATNKTVEWELVSEDDAVTVAEDGLTLTVTGVKEGEATIKVKTDDGEFEAQCTISVYTAITSFSIGVAQNDVLSFDQTNKLITIENGDTADLILTINPTNATYKAVQWSSSASNKVSVDQNGKITAAGVTGGNDVTITVTSVKQPNMSATVKVKVVISVTGVEIHNNGEKITSLRLDRGAEAYLTAAVLPENATNQNVTWEIVEGDEYIQLNNGIVTGIADGNARIRVTTQDGNFTAEIPVTVEQFAEGVRIYHNGEDVTQTTVFVDEGDYIDIEAVIAPADAANKNVTWSVSQEGVVSLEEDGSACRINADEIGVANVCVTTEDGGFEALVIINVVKGLDSLGISFNIDDVLEYDSDNNVITLEKDQTISLSPVFTPFDAYFKDVVWSSGAADLVSVTAAGGSCVLTALEQTGDTVVTITATSERYSEIFATIKVKVKVSVTDVDILVDGKDVDDEYRIRIDDTVELTAVISPDDATDKGITWEVVSGGDLIETELNDDVFTVTAIEEGFAVIKVTTADGGIEKQITLNIKLIIDLDSLSLGAGELILERGEEYTLEPEFEPDNATYKELQWSSSAPEYVSVDENGKLTALKKTAEPVTITATSVEYPYISATRLVIVWVSVTDIEMSGMITDELIFVDDQIQLEATVYPEDANNTGVIWESSDDDIATVVDGLVTVLSAGEVTITVRSAEDAELYYSWTFTAYDVNNKPAELGLDGELAQGFVMINSPANSLVTVTPEADGILYYSADAALFSRLDLITMGESMEVSAGEQYYIMLNIESAEVLSARFVLTEDVEPWQVDHYTEVSDVLVISWSADDFLVPDTSSGQIATWANLKTALLAGNSDITLACNIDAGGEAFCGTAEYSYTFDGQGFYILNFNFVPTGNESGGLFKRTKSPTTFKNFTFINPIIEGAYNQLGLLAATNVEWREDKTITVENVHVVNMIYNGTDKSQFGAFFGRFKGAGEFIATITDCSVSGVVSGGIELMGGLVGYCDYAATSILNVEDTTVNITYLNGTGNRRGGIIGLWDGSGTITVTDCSVKVLVKNHKSERFGGVAGQIMGGATVTIKNSKVTLDQTSDLTDQAPGDNQSGGAFGRVEGTNTSVTLEECFISNSITGNIRAGRSGGAIGTMGDVGGFITVNNCKIVFNDQGTAEQIAERKGGFIGVWESTRVIMVNSSQIIFEYSGAQGNMVGGFAGTREGDSSAELNTVYLVMNIQGTPGQTSGFIGAMGGGATAQFGSLGVTIVQYNYTTLEPLYGHSWNGQISEFTVDKDFAQIITDSSDIDDDIALMFTNPDINNIGYQYWTYDSQTKTLSFDFTE